MSRFKFFQISSVLLALIVVVVAFQNCQQSSSGSNGSDGDGPMGKYETDLIPVEFKEPPRWMDLHVPTDPAQAEDQVVAPTFGQTMVVDMETGDVSPILTTLPAENDNRPGVVEIGFKCLSEQTITALQSWRKNLSICEKVITIPDGEPLPMCPAIYSQPEFALRFAGDTSLYYGVDFNQTPVICEMHHHTVCPDQVQRFKGFIDELRREVQATCMGPRIQ